MFIATLLTMAKIWKQPKCPSIDEWIMKMWYTHTHTHTHTQWNTTRPQKDEILPFATTWMNLEDIMLSEISQKEKVKDPYGFFRAHSLTSFKSLCPCHLHRVPLD